MVSLPVVGTSVAGAAPAPSAPPAWATGADSESEGELRVTTSPAVASTIVVDGVPRDQWGLTWLDLPAESYEVCFTDVPGYATPPCETVEVVAGATTELVGEFNREAVLQVVTSPPVPSTVTVREVGGGVAVPVDKWGVFTHVTPGRTLEVCFGPAAGFTPPGCQTVPAQELGPGAFKQVTGVFAPDPSALGPAGKGELRVTTSPAVPAQVLVDGVPRDQWGLDWLELGPGSHEVCFGDVPGYGSPACQTVEIVAGQTTEVVGTFTVLGFLRAITDPAVEATVGVAGLARNDWGFWFALEAGAQQVCWGPASGSGAQPVPLCETVTVTAGQTTTVTGDYSAVPAGPAELSTPALPEGDARFVDSIVRDLIGRPPTEQEQSTWTQLLEAGTPRAAFVATLADRDEFLSMVVDNQYVSILDRLPAAGERAAGITQVRSDSTTSNLAVSLFAGDEFFALAESTDAGFVATAAQRVLHRDLFPDDYAEIVAELSGGGLTRAEAAAGLYGRDEAGQVRAKMWSQKLLSRSPTASELAAWGELVLADGDVATVVAIAASTSYDQLAQQRFVQTTMTTAPGTVVVTGEQVVSATYLDDGTATVVLAAGVVPASVGNHLVVDVPADPAAGGIGEVTALAPGPGGQTTVSMVAAGIADAFATGEVIDTTELTGVDLGKPAAGSEADDPACSAAFSTRIRAEIDVDTRNQTSISWNLWDFDATIAATITPRLSVTLDDLSLSGTCRKNLLNLKWDAPIPAGPITIPGYFQVSSDIGVTATVSALDLTTSVSLPCKVGVRVTKNGATNLSGCSKPRSTVTVTPSAAASFKAFADLKVGYFLGVDKGAWAKVNIGLTFGPQLGVELKASPNSDPFWDLTAYLDLNLDLTGNLLGRWKINFKLANKQLWERELASGAKDEGTTSGNGTYRTNPDAAIAPGPGPAPTPTGEPSTLATGYDHTCAVVTNGRIRCWGSNDAGNLGNGTTTSSNVPVSVSGLSGAVEVTAGAHSCALLTSGGSVKCWGPNDKGQLGNGKTANSSVPVAVSGMTGPVGITDISAGLRHTCALLPDGGVKCWGSNQYGQLGNLTLTDSRVPVTVVDPAGVPLTGATAIASGTFHSCALFAGGTAKCWGVEGGAAGLGDTPYAVPVYGLTGATAITAGLQFNCALLTGGSVKCWGRNDRGQAGQGTTGGWVNLSAPVIDSGGAAIAGVTSVSAGAYFMCVRTIASVVRCWGDNRSGELGDGSFTDRNRAANAKLAGVSAVAAGLDFTCAESDGDGVRCWGNNSDGQLGAGAVLVDVVTYNVANGCTTGPSCNGSAGQEDIKADLDAGGIKADVYAIQEFCSYHREIDDALGSLFLRVDGWEATPDEGGACGRPERSYGNVLYVDTSTALEWTPTDPPIYFSVNDGGTGDPKNRNVACTHTHIHHAAVLVCNTHLTNSNVPMATTQSGEILEWVEANRRPYEAVIVAGDFNLRPGDADPDWDQAWRDAGFVNANTNDLPTAGSSQIDYIWVSGATPRPAATIYGNRSDHLALRTQAELDLGANPIPMPVVSL